ncbi:beta-ketoacyl synthase chain length factor [Stenotrophomonas maltophilia]|uniref:beta-ketoacyl synthase chain length factor n=1 Tax=Stenotrophomonas TaxID=40323 RepID=UPI0006C26454|nr:MULTISPECIES: beta-ketoacyl synthase chain length factor [Stenotrophomonas]KAA3597626.1 3-oxoacyl-ACP synthase [Stenotrophomonas maltophilia]TGR46344.1 3-oxoacyl-ACP synthase [bacterium M00.F.Ca.ET.199.01.1.1]TGT01591.1 3-oxoacyl-ACP synthase [bacterium M00.F.Ca.ET.177.01.1.1]TGT59220.1 3-oxoacyl-ACP synthase [Mesorhizobium sp. M00.F.Ca.ET.170.01.1.1]TGU10961.1 3-oxoacyl-ACP synthase [bacterium M00.F.Ca.ET.163.01.1.1]TGU92599.1 3-oxoacyl-ACP synthase [Mesorhizobium sp. M00.F.Ca.ET.151.01.1
MIEFSIVDWAAWAPGLSERSQWLGWAGAPYLPQGEDTPALAEIPAMQRRRIERLGRMAIQTACWCEDGQGADSQVPLVFASRHGDVARSMDLLGALASDQPLSPTGFGLSVHNAIAALYSIARGHRGNYLALAAGQATVEAACLEAAGLLADGAREVRVVVYESPLPEIYATFADEPDPFFAWCWRLTAPTAGQPVLSLQWDAAPATADTAPGTLPHALDLHRFLLSGAPALEHVAQGQRWRWGRRG